LARQRATELLAKHDLPTAQCLVAAHVADLEREHIYDRDTRARLLQWRLIHAEPRAAEPEIALPDPVRQPATPATPESLLWKRTLRDLELQMTRATFDTWLRDSVCLGTNSNPHALVVRVRNQYAVAWLEKRLYPVIERTLRRVGENEELTVHFIVPEAPRESAQQLREEG